MTDLQNIITVILVVFGAFFMFVGSFGIIRLPDFYSRTHAIGKSDTLGIMLVLAGLMVYEGFTPNSVKLAVAIVLVMLANPTGSHAMARAAFKYGLKPWFNKDVEKNTKKNG